MGLRGLDLSGWWWLVANTVMGVRLHWKSENFLTWWSTINVSRRTLLYWISLCFMVDTRILHFTFYFPRVLIYLFYCVISLCSVWGIWKAGKLFWHGDVKSSFRKHFNVRRQRVVGVSPFSLWTPPIKLKCCECSAQDEVSAEDFVWRTFTMMTACTDRELDVVHPHDPR